MKTFLNLALSFLLFSVISSCSSTQSSVYKPSDSSTGWKVEVTKKGGIPDEFICKINGESVMSASFPFIGDSFEKEGTYKGRKVMMNGYRKTNDKTDANGNHTSEDSYQIRVFIDDKLVDKFDF